ncbi:MAG: hypothetical protein EGR42_03270 [[Eubacterium] rectale]|nr:hypothetical protein [Agathobacter rectalis]
MGEKLVLKMNGIAIGTADTEGMQLVMAEPFMEGADSRKLNVNVSDEAKMHSTMSYTTDMETLKLIFKFQTFRSSSLANANLNDPMEKERVGVSEYAKGRFITCFCQSDHECVPFWMYYGKEDRKAKVLLQFENFAESFTDYIYTDYALAPYKKKCIFKSSDNMQLINYQHCDESIADNYDLRGIIDAILMFDIKYVPTSSEVFFKENSGIVDVDFSKVGTAGGTVIKMQGIDPTILGKQKSNPWDYEKETRIMSVLSGTQFPMWDYIDLRLKPEIFRNLHIILSPWDEGGLREEIQQAIDTSNLSQDIKDSISIADSSLKGKLNFPEN